MIAEQLQRLWNRLRGILTRGAVTRVDDSAPVQRVQVRFLGDRVSSGVERFQDFGLSSVPMPEDATGLPEAVLGAVAANADHFVTLGLIDRRHRPTGLKDGETILYNAHDVRLYLKDDGTLLIEAPTKVTVDAPAVHVLHDLQVDGNVQVAGTIDAVGDIASAANLSAGGDVGDANGTLEEHRSWAASHVHGGSPTAPPGAQSDTLAPTSTP